MQRQHENWWKWISPFIWSAPSIQEELSDKIEGLLWFRKQFLCGPKLLQDIHSPAMQTALWPILEKKEKNEWV